MHVYKSTVAVMIRLVIHLTAFAFSLRIRNKRCERIFHVYWQCIAIESHTTYIKPKVDKLTFLWESFPCTNV